MNRREVLGMSRLTYKFQVTIPKKVRDELSFKEGDTIVFLREDGKVTIVKSTDI